MCGDTIMRPLSMIFDSAIKLGEFPDSWKKGNIIPTYL